MKKIHLTAILLLLSAFFPGNALPNDRPVNDPSYQKVIDLPSQTKQQIFEKSKQWIAKTFVSSKQVIEYENLQEGKIIGNGSVNFVGTYAGSLFGPTRGIEFQALFLMTEDIKDGKARITFDKIRVQDNPETREIGGYSGISEQGYDRLKKRLIELTQNLTEFLNKNAPDNW